MNFKKEKAKSFPLSKIFNFMPATKISLDHAKKEKLFYFVANVVVYREADKRCLILKRHEREIVHHGRWAVPGGKLEWADFDIARPARDIIER